VCISEELRSKFLLFVIFIILPLFLFIDNLYKEDQKEKEIKIDSYILSDLSINKLTYINFNTLIKSKNICSINILDEQGAVLYKIANYFLPGNYSFSCIVYNGISTKLKIKPTCPDIEIRDVKVFQVNLLGEQVWKK